MKKIYTLSLAVLLLALSCQKADRSEAEMPGLTSMARAEAHLNTEPIQRCAAHEVLQRQIAENPERGRRLDVLERFIQERINSKGKPPGTGGGNGGGGGGNTDPDPVTRGKIYIPVVVHVVLKNPAQVTSQQINSQIDVLNRDFQKANSELANTSVYLADYLYSNVADCQIEFVLDHVIPKTTTVSTFGTNDAVKRTSSGGSDPVSPESKLNMWVCDLGSGLLGYAQFPGGSLSTDGVVIDYQAFGTTASYALYSDFNLGRTATHEIGHWLNLRHIWGDMRCGSDNVDDTPQHDGANYNCGSVGQLSGCKGRPKEMWMNYMDYTDDRCMYMFTSGQKQRMDLTLEGARSGYVSATATRYLVRR